MNRTSFFGRLGAILAAPIAAPLTKALAPTTTEAPMIVGQLAQGTAVWHTAYIGADEAATYTIVEAVPITARWLPPANTLP